MGQTILVLEYKKRNYHKIFHSSVIVSKSDIDKAFISMHQSIMKKIKVILVNIRLDWIFDELKKILLK